MASPTLAQRATGVMLNTHTPTGTMAEDAIEDLLVNNPARLFAIEK